MSHCYVCHEDTAEQCACACKAYVHRAVLPLAHEVSADGRSVRLGTPGGGSAAGPSTSSDAGPSTSSVAADLGWDTDDDTW